MLNFPSLLDLWNNYDFARARKRKKKIVFTSNVASWQGGGGEEYNVRASLPSSFARPLLCSQTRSPIRKSTLAICWNTYERIYTTIMPLKHAESRAIQPLFRRYRVWRCSPLFPSVVVVGEDGRQRFKQNRSRTRTRGAIM